MSRQKNKERCPLCDKHCPLISPRCRRGEKYARRLQKTNVPQPVPTSDQTPPNIDDTLLKQLHLLSRSLQLQTQDSSSRYRIFCILAERGRIGQQELKDLLGIKSGSLSELLAKLEKKNLIRRKKNETDKRNRDIVLTEDGGNWLRDHKPKGSGASHLFSVLSADEKAQLSALLGRLVSVDTQNPPAEPQSYTQPMISDANICEIEQANSTTGDDEESPVAEIPAPEELCAANDAPDSQEMPDDAEESIAGE